MLVWTKVAVLLGVSSMLMGSKLIIHVPDGGSVVSSSGLFACAAGEVCTIDVDEQYFAETFTAVANAGYKFENWGGRSGAVCRGSQNLYCAELDTDFEGSPARLLPGSVVTLSPSFSARVFASTAPKRRFSVSSFHTTRYYEVSGNTQQEVWAQLQGSANPLTIIRETGNKPLGHASLQYNYNYQGEYAANSLNCRVKSGKLEFRFETVLPLLAETEGSNEQFKKRWLPFQERIAQHEAGHHIIYRQLVTQLPQVLTDIGAVRCNELDDKVRVAVADAVRSIRRASADYDENYGGEDYMVSSI